MQADTHRPLFHWRGIAKDGLPRAGWSTARDPDELSRSLGDDGVTMLAARRCRRARLSTVSAYRFLEQLSSLLGAGVPILDALELIRQDKAVRGFEAIVCGVIESVKSGLALSESLAPFLEHGDRIITQALMLGERSGKFDEVLIRLLAQRKKTVRTRAQLARAAIYPATLMVVSAAVILLMMIWVIPEFNDIYADFGAALPAYTLAVIAFSELVIERGPVTAAWLAAAGGGLFALQRANESLRRLLARVQLRLPLAGWLVRIRLYRQFAADMSLIYGAGMPFSEALNWLPSTTTHPHYRTVLERVCMSVRHGTRLHEALEEARFFSPLIVQTVRVGENSGSLERAFERIEHFYDEAIEITADRLVRLFEPLLVSVLSLVVGALVIAMYLPMFNLGFAL